MHYYIDGYNMLFRLLPSDSKLQASREQIIKDINKKIAVVKIDVSIVFDATFQVGDRTRTHFNELEILFTAEGETADEFILDEIKNSSNPRQETVVTSDKKLAQQVRRYSAHTESIEAFMLWLNRVYKNRLKQTKRKISSGSLSSLLTEQITPTSETESVPIQIDKTPLAIKKGIPSKKATIEECASYYEEVFGKEFEELLKAEKPKRIKKSSRQPKKNIKKQSPFDQPKESVEGPTQMDRWLKTFENRADNPKNDSKH